MTVRASAPMGSCHGAQLRLRADAARTGGPYRPGMRWPGHACLLGAAVALALSLTAAPAGASTASEEQQGAALVKALRVGTRSCKTFSATEFERIGEYAMGLNFATVARHDAMNRHMRAMMATQGEQ